MGDKSLFKFLNIFIVILMCDNKNHGQNRCLSSCKKGLFDKNSKVQEQQNKHIC